MSVLEVIFAVLFILLTAMAFIGLFLIVCAATATAIDESHSWEECSSTDDKNS